MNNPRTITAKIAYLLEDFLDPTTTFVTQEILFIRNCGMEVKVYVAGVCPTSGIDPANSDLLNIAKFSRPVNAKQMIHHHVAALVGYPGKYIETLWRLFRTTWDRPAYLMRSLRYFLDGIYLGSQMVQEEIMYSIRISPGALLQQHGRFGVCTAYPIL